MRPLCRSPSPSPLHPTNDPTNAQPGFALVQPLITPLHELSASVSPTAATLAPNSCWCVPPRPLLPPTPRTDFLKTGTLAKGSAETGMVEAYMCAKVKRNPAAQAYCAEYLGYFTSGEQGEGAARVAVVIPCGEGEDGDFLQSGEARNCWGWDARCAIGMQRRGGLQVETVRARGHVWMGALWFDPGGWL